MLTAGAKLGRYEICSKLGEGGMGEVYLAQDTKLDRKVALKTLPAVVAADRSRMNRFVQEAKAASALNHPNIITIHEIDETDSGHFIATEFIDGETLRERLRKGPIPVSQALDIATQVASALATAHHHGIIHRDIKPENVMVRADGLVKVLDFGLAKLTAAGASDPEDVTRIQSDTQPGMILGTVAYMSPEQARGQAVDTRTDIWSLGVLLYEMLSRCAPFRGETASDTLANILHREPDALNLGALSGDLAKILERMLAKELAARYPTMADVLSDLKILQRRVEFDREMQQTVLRSSVQADVEIIASATASKAESQTPGDSASSRTDEGFWVAVLPFKYSGSNPDLEALAEGLSEDIVTGLSRFSYLRVIARGSTLKYSNESGDVREIGKQLGARYVMEGSIRQAGTMLRVTVQLVDTHSGAHLWAETYNRPFQTEDIFSVQDELVPCIVSTVADWYGVLPHSMGEAVRLKPPDQLSPYEGVLRSFAYYERVTPEGHAAVRAGLERAVEQAPGYADGWAMLSVIYGDEHRFGFNKEPDALGRSLNAAQRAVDSASSNHYAYLALAQALFFRKEFSAFRGAAERAIALNPMDGAVVEYMSHLIAFSGDWDRGCDLAERARQLNPNHPGWYWSVQFYDAYRQGDYAGALAITQKVTSGMGEFIWHVMLAALYGQLGNHELADKAVRELLTLQPDFALVGRRELEKWYPPDLVEQLLDGFRKAGLEMVDQDLSASPSPATDAAEMAEFSPSIAVLPFANLSNDPDNDYFCDGLAEELLNALSKIDQLKVAARTSAFSFKGKDTTVSEIGQKLSVNSVLEGSVRRSGNRLRITVQLVNASDGYHLWSERYDRELRDIFDVQDEITLAVVDALRLKLFGAEKAAVLKRYTDNVEAHELFFKGRYHHFKYTAEGWKRAIEFFKKAIEIEPSYAPAYAAMTLSWGYLWFFGLVPSEVAIASMKAGTAEALKFDKTLAEAHLSSSMVTFFHDWEWRKAEEEFSWALDLNPNNAEVYSFYSMFLALEDRFDEAIVQSKKSLALDPLSPLINMNAGWTYFTGGLMDKAAEQVGRMIEIEPGFYGAYWLRGAIYLTEGNYEKAVDELKKAVSHGGHQTVLADLGSAYGLAGRKEEAESVLNELLERRQHDYVSAICIARVYCRLGQTDRTIEWLEKAFAERNGEMLFLKGEIEGAAKNDPLIDLDSDPRVAAIFQKMNLAKEKDEFGNP